MKTVYHLVLIISLIILANPRIGAEAKEQTYLMVIRADFAVQEATSPTKIDPEVRPSYARMSMDY
jgi:hypothetical protein